jgi:general secretion pathway protein K
MRSERENHDSGFVLVVVLWILSAFATLAAIYSAYAVTTSVDIHAPDDRLQAEASFRAAVEMTAFQQLATPEPVRPSHGAFSLRVGRTNVAVRFQSEGARIDLNAASEDLLSGLFAAIGVAPPSAKVYASRVVGWRTKPAQNVNSKEAELYAQLRVPYPPRQAPFEDVLELSLLPDLPPPVVERVLPFVTVFSGRSTVDVASADPTVLSALPGMTPAMLTALLNARARNSGDEKELLALLGPTVSGASVDRPKAIHAAIDVNFDSGRRVHAEVVLRLAETGKEPYDLLYWRDDFDGPTSS